MKIVNKSNTELEPAHGGFRGRKLFVAEDELKNIQGITQGYLPAQATSGWHKHDDCNEFMFVIKGKGFMKDEEGEYSFKTGDFFVFPKGVFHEQINRSTEEIEFVFVRIKE